LKHCHYNNNVTLSVCFVLHFYAGQHGANKWVGFSIRVFLNGYDPKKPGGFFWVVPSGQNPEIL